jgi:hypothetical protein
MPTWVERIERIRGKGRLIGGKHVYSVGYAIDVYQKYAESVPTFRFAKGHLTGMKAGDLAHAMLPLAALDLELQDARHAQVLLKNLDGDFDVTGPIAPLPAKKEKLGGRRCERGATGKS